MPGLETSKSQMPGLQGLYLVLMPILSLRSCHSVYSSRKQRAGSRLSQGEKSFLEESSEREGSTGNDLGVDSVPASEDCIRGLSKSRVQQILLGGWRKQGITWVGVSGTRMRIQTPLSGCVIAGRCPYLSDSPPAEWGQYWLTGGCENVVPCLGCGRGKRHWISGEEGGVEGNYV